MPAAPTALELIERAAAGPGRIRFEPSGTVTELAEVWHQARAVASWLLAKVGPGGRVGAFLSNTPLCPAVVFGVWLSGNDLVSLPYPGRGTDLTRFTEQVDRMCGLAAAEVVLIDDAYRSLLPELAVPTAGFGEAVAGAPGRRPGGVDGAVNGTVDGGGGLVQFTSGSLGSPKGVVLSGQALAANILGIVEGMGGQPGDRAASWLPLSHDMGFVGMFLSSLAAMAPHVGGELLVLQTPESFLADPSSWLRLCDRYRVTVTTAPNFAFDLSVRAAPLLGGIDLSAMRICITGAERVRAQTLQRFTEAFTPAGLPVPAICPAYGMAEAALAVTIQRPDQTWTTAVRPGEPDLLDVGNGTPVAGMELRIAEADTTTGIGEVQIRGESLFEDYLGAERVLTEDGWFPTRDVGYLAGGQLHLVGRVDESIIVGGRNLYSPDIEHAVRHPAVRAGCLAAVPTETGFALVAEPVGGLQPDELTRVCRELAATAAAEIGARPELVGFVPRGRLLKTPSGKLRRRVMSAALAVGELELIAASGRRR